MFLQTAQNGVLAFNLGLFILVFALILLHMVSVLSIVEKILWNTPQGSLTRYHEVRFLTKSIAIASIIF